jgi:two-component system cell cycle response regulator
MEISQLFFGKIGYIYSYSSTILILSLMFIISMRLFMSRRKKAYFSLTISLAIIIAQYVLLIIYTLNHHTDLESTEYLAQLLQVLAFILINMGIYQLYNASKSREYSFFLSFVSIGIFIGLLRYYLVISHSNPSVQYLRFQNIWIEIYLLLLTFLGFYIVSPHIGQRLKYQIALTIYFFTQLSRIIDHYILSEPKSSLLLVENFAPILFYIILFIIIFDRVVELLQAIYDSSIKDGLTSLYNRHYFFNRVAECINRGERVSVIFCDIDNFKKLNDTKGHQMGDKVLKQVSSIMMEESDNIGIAGRYGGEELVILLTDTSLRVENVADKVRRRVEAETGVTVSIGYSKYRKTTSPQELIEQADMAMYQSKKTGKNRITAYPSQ